MDRFDETITKIQDTINLVKNGSWYDAYTYWREVCPICTYNEFSCERCDVTKYSITCNSKYSIWNRVAFGINHGWKRFTLFMLNRAEKSISKWKKASRKNLGQCILKTR